MGKCNGARKSALMLPFTMTSPHWCHPETAGAARSDRDVCAVRARRRRTAKDLQLPRTWPAPRNLRSFDVLRRHIFQRDGSSTDGGSGSLRMTLQLQFVSECRPTIIASCRDRAILPIRWEAGSLALRARRRTSLPFRESSGRGRTLPTAAVSNDPNQRSRQL